LTPLFDFGFWILDCGTQFSSSSQSKI